MTPDDVEAAQRRAARARDAVWAVRRDRIRTANAVADFAGRDAGVAAVAGYLSVQQALSAIDRMEVRGRDSAGIHVFVWHHGLDPADPAVRQLLAERTGDPLFQSGSVRLAGPCLSLVYKAAAEIGELGDNVKSLRAAVLATRCCASRSLARRRVSVLGHTRWASVGIISEPNCHPVNGEQAEQRRSRRRVPLHRGGAQRRRRQPRRPEGHPRLRIAGPITTDAKVIPAVMALHAGGRQQRSRRGVPSHRCRVRGQRGHRRRGGRRARSGVPRAARQRAGALRRPRRRHVHRGQRALRRGRGDRPSYLRVDGEPRRPAAVAARCSCSTVPEPARSPASDASPTTAPISPWPTTRSSPRRSPPATSTAAMPRTSC